MEKRHSGLTNLAFALTFSTVLYVIYKYIDIELGLFLSLNSLILLLKSEAEKQAAKQDNRLDKLEVNSVSQDAYREDYYKLYASLIRTKAYIDVIQKMNRTNDIVDFEKNEE